jgi:ATP-dependent Lon protease
VIARTVTARGLVVTGIRGDIGGEGKLMPVESIATPGSGNLKLTSLLGMCVLWASLKFYWCFSRLSKRARSSRLVGSRHMYDLAIITKHTQDPLYNPDAMIDVHLHLTAETDCWCCCVGYVVHF